MGAIGFLGTRRIWGRRLEVFPRKAAASWAEQRLFNELAARALEAHPSGRSLARSRRVGFGKRGAGGRAAAKPRWEAQSET